jgi:hypothetical protein
MNSNSINSKQLKTLECPTLEEQNLKWTRILESFKTNDKIKLLVESKDYTLISSKLFQRKNEDKHSINPIYVLKVKDNRNNNLECKLILKIFDDHPFLEHCVINAVSILNYLKINRKIPVPDVISYSDNDCETNLIGCKYILMSKVKGKLLGDLFSKASDIPESLLTQLIGIYNEMKSIKMNNCQKIGHFNENMEIISKSCRENVLSNDETFLSYFNSQMNWIMKEMSKIEYYKQMIKETNDFAEALNLICKNNYSLNNLNFQDEITLCNLNINKWTILVDEENLQITALIDWDQAYWGFDHVGLNIFDSLGFKNNSCLHEESNSIKIRNYLDGLVEKSKMLVFYYCSNWFKVYNCTLIGHFEHWYALLKGDLYLSDMYFDILNSYQENKKDFEFDIITNDEWNTLESCSFKQQNEEMKKVLDSLNNEKFKCLAESVGFKLKKGHIFQHDNGIVNSIFVLNVEDDQFNQKQLFLKIADTHHFFKTKKVTNEVGVLNYLFKNTNIPVPKVLSFSNDSRTSLIGCEYILLEKVEGQNLRELLNEKYKCIDNLPEKIIDNMLELFKEFKKIKINEKKIGNFDLDMNVIDSFGPNVMKCDSFLQYMMEQFEWSINQMSKVKALKKLASKTDHFCKTINEIVKENKDLDDLNFNDEMALNHGDLHPGILIFSY